jgi:phage tail-like protein
MARTVAEDHFQSYRFRVFEVDGNAAAVFAGETPVAGFTTVTTPEVTVEMAEHRTGSEKYTRKYPGPPTYGEGTMTRGLLKGDNTFYNWLQKYLTGQPFRTDLIVRMYDQTAWAVDGGVPEEFIAEEKWKECFPNSIKLMGDLDASGADVNIQEITVAVEEVEFSNVAAA